MYNLIKLYIYIIMNVIILGYYHNAEGYKAFLII